MYVPTARRGPARRGCHSCDDIYIYLYIYIYLHMSRSIYHSIYMHTYMHTYFSLSLSQELGVRLVILSHCELITDDLLDPWFGPHSFCQHVAGSTPGSVTFPSAGETPVPMMGVMGFVRRASGGGG